GDGDALFQLKSDSLPYAHAQTTKTYYKHRDSRTMKAQELKTKTSAQTLIYKIFLQRYQVYQGRLLASFQDDAKYEHPRSKSYVEAFEMEGEDDWLGSFEVGRDEDGNVKYGPVAPSFIDIEDDMERALAMEAYFNPFKNVIVFKKLVDFLGSLPVQLKNLDWGNEGYGTYKKVDGDGD
ncbi:hypothetical protein Tco_0785013, partial [Tanacetum coccineum]